MPTASPDLLAALRAEVRAVVREELATLGVGATEYRSSAPPPHTTRRTFNRVAPRVPGARRDGREWVVLAHAWRAFRSAGPKPGAGRDGEGKYSSTTTAPANDSLDVDVLLASAGLRRTARRSR